jgi:hypothetical protein
MRVFSHSEPGGERGEIDEWIDTTEQEILDMRWDWWYDLMVKKYGEGHPLITEENCIQDWVTDHYAFEIK